MNQHPEPPVDITSARPSRSSDIRTRQMRYLFSMSLRTLCFVLAVVTPSPLRWFFVAGAVFLPYVAVVLANATDRRHGSQPASFEVADVRRLGSSSADARVPPAGGSRPTTPTMPD